MVFFTTESAENVSNTVMLISAICGNLIKECMLWLLADVCKDATVNIEDMPVHGIGGMRSKEYGRTSEFLGVEPSPCGCLGADERVEGMAAAVCLTLAQRCCLRCGDVARTDGVALYVVTAIL